MSASPAAASRVGGQSRTLTISLDTDPGFDLARPADHGRYSDRPLPVGVLLAAERGHRPVRPGVHVEAIVGRIHG